MQNALVKMAKAGHRSQNEVDNSMTLNYAMASDPFESWKSFLFLHKNVINPWFLTMLVTWRTLFFRGSEMIVSEQNWSKVESGGEWLQR